MPEAEVVATLDLCGEGVGVVISGRATRQLCPIVLRDKHLRAKDSLPPLPFVGVASSSLSLLPAPLLCLCNIPTLLVGAVARDFWLEAGGAILTVGLE